MVLIINAKISAKTTESHPILCIHFKIIEPVRIQVINGNREIKRSDTCCNLSRSVVSILISFQINAFIYILLYIIPCFTNRLQFKEIKICPREPQEWLNGDSSPSLMADTSITSSNNQITCLRR